MNTCHNYTCEHLTTLSAPTFEFYTPSLECLKEAPKGMAGVESRDSGFLYIPWSGILIKCFRGISLVRKWQGR